jgi:hypothetical protein
MAALKSEPYMSRDMRLLDDLLGGPMSFTQAERWIFGGDRSGLLNSLRKMQADGVLLVLRGTAPVQDWQMASWLRDREDPATCTALKTVVIDITDAGIRLMG